MKYTNSLILRNARLKITPARVAILELFSKDCKPIDAEYIFNKVKAKKINQVTVYRTLTSLEKAGILKRVDLRKDSVFYELAEHHHHHIICTQCGITEEFERCNIGRAIKEVLASSKHFNAVREHSLELFGVCKSCSKR